MSRNKWAIRIAHTISELECINEDDGLHTALEHLDNMLLEALEPAERKIYDKIVEWNTAILSADVALEFGIKQNHASGILKALTDYCLLDRREDVNEDGRYFIYTLHKL